MPLQDDFQAWFVKVSLLEHLFDASKILVLSHAGGNRDDMLGTENPGGHALVFESLRFADGFLR